MSFKGNKIQVKHYMCNPESIISYNETLLDEQDMVWVGLLTTTKDSDIEEIEELISNEYHPF
jgi:hypothetical protein